MSLTQISLNFFASKKVKFILTSKQLSYFPTRLYIYYPWTLQLFLEFLGEERKSKVKGETPSSKS